MKVKCSLPPQLDFASMSLANWRTSSLDTLELNLRPSIDALFAMLHLLTLVLLFDQRFTRF